ncbi:MAG TPA: peptide ABC transporter substrate-binding protein [Thermomicrobiales bacterium]|nr:peptide ABC transporter substrate-binding protein [Thermomicrobiales bacterium]
MVKHRNELAELERAWRRSQPVGTRREMLKWSAIAAGAVATMGTGVAVAAPAQPSGAPAALRQQDIEKDVTITVPLDPYGQVVTLDPHRSVNWGPFWAMFPNVWGGLVRYDENAKVQLDLAESYTVSEDGKTYTFKIRSDAKFANGNKVTADHFVTSWKRALNPDQPSPMAYFMEPVRNYRKYLQKTSDAIGFKAIDDATVEITLSRAYSYFLSYLAAYVWSVVDPTVVDKEGDEGFPLKDAGTGPWRFTEFDASSQLVMEPNPNHYGGVSPSIVKVVWPFVTGPTAANTALNMYKQDKAISADVPISLKSSVERDPDLSKELASIQTSGSVRVLAFDFKQEPFTDVRVRKAFGLAVDRDKFKSLFEDTWTPTRSFTPPVVTLNSEYQPPQASDTDVNQAKSLLEAAGFKDGEGIPQITYYQPSEDTEDEKARWRSFLDSITEAIGVQISHDTSMSLDQIEQLRLDNGGLQFNVTWWWNTTETPYLVSQVFSSTSPYNKGFVNWDDTAPDQGDLKPGADSREFDTLVKKADVEQDQATRNDLYKQAEELVLRNAVCVPLANWVQQYVQKAYLQGTKQGPWTGRIPVWFDKDAVVVKHG